MKPFAKIESVSNNLLYEYMHSPEQTQIWLHGLNKTFGFLSEQTKHSSNCQHNFKRNQNHQDKINELRMKSYDFTFPYKQQLPIHASIA